MTAVRLIGYGTLLHRRSLGHSIGQDSARLKEIVPVTVPDHRRLFNLRPKHYVTSHKLHEEPIENGAMNVEVASGVELNALAFTVSSEELDKLDRREHYYFRKRVPILHFDTGESLGEGHIYITEPDAAWIERDPRRLMPLWRDVVWARDGAGRIGDEFGRRFDETTYLADGRTLVVDAYRKVLDQTEDVEMPERETVPEGESARG